MVPSKGKQGDISSAAGPAFQAMYMTLKLPVTLALKVHLITCMFGESENVALRLTNELEPNKHNVFFDNLFASPELLIHLKTCDIFAVGPLRQHRTRGCPLPRESKSGRGTISEFTEKDALCAWYDNRRVITISNFVGKDTVSNAKRFDRKTRR